MWKKSVTKLDSTAKKLASDVKKTIKTPVKAQTEEVISEKLAAKEKSKKYISMGLIPGALILVILILASISNTQNYYIKNTDASIEIWQGKFAPLGEKLIISLPGAHVPEKIEPVYSKEDVFPLVFKYYIDKADGLIDVPGIPDFHQIKLYLTIALEYGVTNQMRNSTYARLNIIDLMLLLYKADVAKTGGRLQDLDDAIFYLEEAELLDVDESHAQLIEGKLESIKKLKAELEQTQAPEAKE